MTLKSRYIPYLGLSLGMMLFSCNANSIDDDQIDTLAHYQIKATTLREARFELADSIRFYIDSIHHHNHGTDSITIAEWHHTHSELLTRKERLATHSRNLADTIRLILLEITGNMSPNEKRDFNEDLQLHVKEITTTIDN